MRRLKLAWLVPILLLVSVSILAIPQRSEAAAAYVQSLSHLDGDAFPNTVTSSFTSTSGNLLTMWVTWIALSGNCTDLSVSDSKGNTWSPAAAAITDGSFCFRMYYAYNITGGSGHTITLSATSNLIEAYALIHEVSGILQTNPLDQSAGENNETGTAVDVGPVTTTEDGEYIFAGIWCANDPCTVTHGAPFSERIDTGTSYPFQTQDYVQPSAGSITPAWTVTGASDARVMVATFKAQPDAASGSATLSKPPNKLGLVGYWSFNEGSGTVATDFSGRGSHGTITGASWANGKLGKALSFSGDNYVDAGTGSALDITGDVTVCAWVRPASLTTSNYRPIMARSTAGFTTQYNLSSEPAGTGAQVSFGWSDDSVNFESYITDSNVLAVGRWTHICGIRGTSDAIYINGASAAISQLSGPASVTTSGGSLAIGKFGEANDGIRWDGLIDEVRIYNRALTAGEVNSLYGSGAVKFTTSSVELTRGSSLANGLVGHWTFDGSDTGTTVTDRSGQGNNGYFINGATSSAKTIGKLGQALNFDGSDDRVSFPSPTLDTVNSAAVWVNAQESPLDAVVIGQNSSGTGQYLLYADATDLYYSVSVGVFANVAHGGIPVGQWTHLAVSRNGTSVTFYKNGVSLGSDTLGGDTVVNNIGSLGGYGDGTFGFQGRIDDVRIYSRALSAAEIKQLYNLGAATISQ
jgi:hypothetical protein